MIRKASAEWDGSAQEGSGRFGVGSGVLASVPYSFAKRFGEEPGTNPEELVAAAHASCFTMALSFGLGNAGFPPERVTTDSTLTMGTQAEGWSVKEIHLTVKAKVPKIGADQFAEIAAGAKENCPISRLLNTTITMDASLVE